MEEKKGCGCSSRKVVIIQKELRKIIKEKKINKNYKTNTNIFN